MDYCLITGRWIILIAYYKFALFYETQIPFSCCVGKEGQAFDITASATLF